MGERPSEEAEASEAVSRAAGPEYTDGMHGSEGSGLPPYRGYEYQIVVSVWVALDLMLEQRLCDSVEIEPASQEDIAADLRVSPELAETTLDVSVADGPIHIQVKHRSSAWNEADFRALVEPAKKQGVRGPAPRERALVRLQADLKLRYLLITDAEIHANLKPLVVESVGEKSSAVAIDSLTDRAEIASRIAVMDKRLLRYVEKDIDDILEKVGNVPTGRASACREEIIEAVRKRLLGKRESRLDLAEVDGILERHEGRPPSASGDFVQPAIYANLQRRLDDPPHALILIGPPGIGKTAAALELIDAHRRMKRPFEVLIGPRPHEVRAALRRSGRFLFYFEDPWGSYRLADEASLWADELPRLTAEAGAHPDKRFLITSRTGLFAEAVEPWGSGKGKEKARRALEAYVASIHEDHFDVRARLEILHRRMRGAGRRHRDWVTAHEAEIVRHLTVPQALVTFANQVKLLPGAEEPKLDDLVRVSQVEAIGAVVARQVRERAAIPAAVVLWALLTTGIDPTEALVRDISVWLDEGTAPEVDLLLLISFLVKSGWLTLRGDGVTAHPSVVAGLEQVVDAEVTKSDRVLRALLAALVNNDIDKAIRLMLGLQNRNLPVPKAVQSAVDRHLREAVLYAEDAAFPAATYPLERLSRSVDPVSMITRALRTVRPRSDALEVWEPPSWSAQEFAVVRASAEAEHVARRYIRLVFVESRIDDGEAALLRFLDSLGWNLHEDFTSAALETLVRSRSPNRLLWQGALSAPSPPYDRLLDAALAEYDEVTRWFNTTGNAEQRKAEESELDAAHSSDVMEEPQERFYAPETALKQIVASRRGREGFEWMRQHPRRSDLLDAWAESIPVGGGDECRQELLALVESCALDSRRPAWKAIGRARCLALADVVLQAITEGSVTELDACLSTLFGIYAPDEMRAILDPTMRTLPWSRRAALAFAASNTPMPDLGDHLYRDPVAHIDVVRELLDPPEREAVAACSAAKTGAQRIEDLELAEPAWARLLELQDGEDEVLAVLACVVLAYHSRLIGGVDGRFLSSRENWTRLHALRALHRVASLRTNIEAFLNDDYYQCRRFAMRALASDASPDERAAILAMAVDKSAPVREACADIIGQYRWGDGLGVLCDLLRDRRDRNEGSAFAGSIPRYHVAHAAARALKRFNPPLPEGVRDILLDLLGREGQASDDPRVHQALIDVVARERVTEVPTLLQQCLSSRWCIESSEQDGRWLERQKSSGNTRTFPLRYAAAWGWLSHLGRYPDDAPLLSADVLAEAAGHSDDRLAAPALLAMGFSWQQHRVHVGEILGEELMTDDRSILIEVGARMRRAPLPDDLLGSRLPPSHSGRRLIGWCFDETIDDEAWKQRLAADEGAQGWLDRIRSATPLHAVLRRVILRSPRGALVQGLSDDDFRQGEVTEGIPYMGIFSTAGLE